MNNNRSTVSKTFSVKALCHWKKLNPTLSQTVFCTWLLHLRQTVFCWYITFLRQKVSVPSAWQEDIVLLQTLLLMQDEDNFMC